MCPFKKAFPFVVLLHLLLVAGIFYGYAEHRAEHIFTLLPAIGAAEELHAGEEDAVFSRSIEPPHNRSTEPQALPPLVTEEDTRPQALPEAQEIVKKALAPTEIPAARGSVAGGAPGAIAQIGGAIETMLSGGVITPPVALKKSKPLRPAGAPKGEVVITFTIVKTGDIENVKVEKSPSEAMSRAVLGAVGRWRFAPARRDGQPIDLPVRQVVEF